MIKLWQKYRNASSEMQGFILVGILFGVCLIFTTLHSYGRLDFVRSYKKNTESATSKTN